MVGRTHVELDVVGAHFTFALLISPLLAATFHWKTITKAREALAFSLNGSEYARTHPTFAKDILTVSLNLDRTRHIAKLSRQRMFFTSPIVTEMLTIIDRAKPDIVAQAVRLGFNKGGGKINATNIVYFALEFVEGTFMRTFVASILGSIKVTSIVGARRYTCFA